MGISAYMLNCSVEFLNSVPQLLRERGYEVHEDSRNHPSESQEDNESEPALRVVVRQADGTGVLLVGGRGWLPWLEDPLESGRAHLSIVFLGHVFADLNPIHLARNAWLAAKGEELPDARMAVEIRDLLVGIGGDEVSEFD